MLEYNFGIKLYNIKNYIDAITWLKESIDVLEKDPKMDVLKQSRSMRALSLCYLEENNLESAISAIRMSNKYHETPNGLMDQIKLFLIKGFEEDIKDSLIRLINHQESKLEE